MTLSDVPRRANEHASLARRIERLEAIIRSIPSRPVNIGVSGPSDAIVDQGLTQTAHGFTVGMVIYWTGTTYAKARANAATTALYAGVVSAVRDANTFDLTYAGIITSPTALAFIPGTTYYLSDATAGATLATAPAATAYQVPVFLCRDVNTLLVFECSGVGSSHLNLHAGDPTAGGGTMRVYSTPAIFVDIDNAGNVTVQNAGDSTKLTYGELAITDGTNAATLQVTGLNVNNGAGESSTITNTGDLVLDQANTNAIQLLTADMTALGLTGKTIKLQLISVCDTGTGLIKQTVVPCCTPF